MPRYISQKISQASRKNQETAGNLGNSTEAFFDKYFVSRLDRLGPVRRFVIAWLLLIVLLIGGLFAQNVLLGDYYQALRPVPGGIYNEGVEGTFTNANPIFATSDVDRSVSRLLFAGLFTYNQRNRLTGELARDYTVDDTGTVYTVHLKPHLTWHDGASLTSSDVVFTYQTIQNPDTQSPLQSGWQNIDISAPDSHTVVFKLPSPLASFPYNLTTGIVPKHSLGGITAVRLRSADFNTVHPIGSGPFAWQAIQVTGNNPSTAQEQIAMVPFANYALGKPKLQEFILHADASPDHLVQLFKGNKLTGLEGLSTVPRELEHMKSIEIHSPLLTAETMVFFKMSSGVLSNQPVRHALVEGTDIQQIIHSLGYPTRAVREPLLPGQVGYDPALLQPSFNQKAAEQTLDNDGWIIGKKGVRYKNGQALSLTLTAANTAEYRSVTKQLQSQWRQLGVDVHIQLQDSADFHNTLAYHNYDAVLYGISIGVDPDVFVYWDSSQADARSSSRLNLSEYKNSVVDASIEAGRSRLAASLRAIKYKPFLEAWQKDYPALGLYQPRMLYMTNGPVAGFGKGPFNSAADRFDNVQNWQIRQARAND